MVDYFKKNINLVLYFILSIFAISPLLSPGFFPMHDDTQVARIFEMAKSLSDGMFPVRWVEDLGYGAGYPIFNFYSVLPYYAGGILTVLGISALESTKLVFIIALVGSGVSMFFLVKELFGKLGGLVAAIIYLYFPYHAVNVYVRGDLAEATAFAFLPLVFLSLFKIHQSNTFSKNYVVLGSLSIAAVILSHNLSSFMLFIFIGIFILASLILTKNKNNLLSYGLILTLAFLLSAFYSIPAILEMKYTNIESIIGGGSDYKDHFVCLNQLWDSPWGFGGSVPGCIDGMSFKLGKLNILLAGLAFALFIINFKKLKEKLFIVSFSFASLLFSAFITLEYSSVIWRLPFMDFLQFPWRFLNFTGLFIGIAAGYLIWQIKKNFGDKISITLASIVILLTLAYNATLFNPKTIHDRESDFYTNELYLKWTVSQISDEYLPKGFQSPSSRQDLSNLDFDSYTQGNPLYNRGTAQNEPFKFDFSQTPIQKASNLLFVIGLITLALVIIGGRRIYGKKAS